MTATVYVLPIAQTQCDKHRPSGKSGTVIASSQKHHRTIKTSLKPTPAPSSQGDDWPPFGGDAA
ncbi:hypothetical protein ACG1BZ_14940 [Microbulbifer sp. CNSA002]|uniref:hypothetical protein n=1 Tax=Microbulbifer sp. CNSA002 TaxID=3373604 RepID=UPI0039B63C48